jgi:CysZ protein
MDEVKTHDSFLQNLLTGVHITFRGLGIFFTRPSCWFYSIVPVLISLLIYGAGVWLFVVYVWPHLPWAETADATLPWWRQWLEWGGAVLMAATLIIIYITLFVFTFSALYMVIGAPFFDRMAAKLEKELYGFEMRMESKLAWLDYFRTAITNALILTVQSIICTIILLPICIFLPYIGFLPFMLVLGYLLGWSFLLYGAEHRRWRRREVKRALKGKRGVVLAFGAMVYLILFIPFAAVLVFPAAVVSGVIIFNEHIDPKSKELPTAPEPPALEPPPENMPVAEKVNEQE